MASTPITIALQGIPVMAQLDRMALTSWQFAIILIGGGAALGIALSALLGDVNPTSPMSAIWTPTVLTGVLVLDCLLIGSSAFNNLILARTTEADLRQLAGFDESLGDCIENLRPRLRIYLPFVAGTIAFLGLAPIGVIGALLGVPLAEVPAVLATSGLHSIVLLGILGPAVAYGFGIGFAQFYLQVRVLTEAAQRVRVDLLHLDRYAAIANPGVRLAVMLLCVASLFPLAFLHVEAQALEDERWGGVMLFVLITVTVLGSYFYPVLVMRNRIRDAKNEEIAALRDALDGDDIAAGRLSITHRGPPETTADFLAHQVFVESRWEWPIATHVQRLLLFGLLPPLTWVLAAVIENLMF